MDCTNSCGRKKLKVTCIFVTCVAAMCIVPPELWHITSHLDDANRDGALMCIMKKRDVANGAIFWKLFEKCIIMILILKNT